MFFQVNVTPKAKQVPRISKDKAEPSAILVLGPFQPQTRLKFETNIGTEISKTLIIKNPTSRSLNIKVIKRPPAERSIILNYSELVIKPNTELELKSIWSPKEIGSWRDTLQFIDSRRIKYDVILTFICTGIKKTWIKGRTRVQALTQSNGIHGTDDKSKILQSSIKVTKANIYTVNELKNNENEENVDVGVKDMINVEYIKSPPKTSYIDEPKSIAVHNFDTSQFQLTPVSAHHSRQSLEVPHIRVLNATPLTANNEKIDSSDKIPEIRILDATEINFASENFTITSSKNFVDGPELRRETYLNPKPKFWKHLISNNESADENFDDSLTQTISTFQSNKVEENLSIALDDIANFSTFMTTPSLAACSTGRKNNSKSEKSFDVDSPPTSAGNNTFDIIKIHDADTLNSKEIRDENLSFTSTHALRNIRANKLATVFAKITSDSPSSNLPQENLLSSPPRAALDHRRINMEVHDHATVKSVLEANLWAEDSNFLNVFSDALLNSNRKKLDKTIKIERSCPNESVTVTKKIQIRSNLTNQETYVSTLRKSPGFHIEISPPKKINKKVSPIQHNKVIKHKSVAQYRSILRRSESKVSVRHRINTSVPSVKISKLCLTNLNTSIANKSSINNITSIKKKNNSKSKNITTTVSNDVFLSIRNCDPFAATITEDPFLTNALFSTEQWVSVQELEFTKWLNALLTPPEHGSDVETTCVDVGKVWQSCRAKENVALAETKEAVSAKYHNTNIRLSTLRKAGFAMLARDEVKIILAQIVGCIDKGILIIRDDRDLHRDIGLQKLILELLLSYNPLWLRIGLEVIYGETIPLYSNNDLIGLTRFLIARFFSDPYLVQTYSQPNAILLRLPAFQSHMNKFILKKFLLIVYFLDYAKRNKLIGHDPCLFHNKATNKESRAILLSFSREVLSGVGDITKILRNYGYVVSHKQTYLDEYNYAVKDISSDLRDGVRLCRVMEFIIGDRSLTYQCRVPSISRLQKIHNVDLALKALIKAGYQIIGDIDAKSIVDGHREKTLSLLWQIIYKFQRPRFEKSAIILQKWWRAMLWYVRVKNYVTMRRNNAACVIQRVWKHYKVKEFTQQLHEIRIQFINNLEKCVRLMQLRWIHKRRMLHDRRNFLQIKAAAVCIQKRFRQIHATRPFVQNLQIKREAAIILQRQLRAVIMMRREREAYNKMKQATIMIQRRWQATCLKCSTQNYYQTLRVATILIQSKWRAKRQMKIERNHYLRMYKAVVKLQTWWKSIIIAKCIRNDYILQRHAIKIIKHWWFNRKLSQIERKNFLTFRNNTIKIQRYWRRYRDTEKYILTSNSYQKSAKAIQTWWRGIKHVQKYCMKRKNAIIIQQWWRSLMITRKTVSDFISVRKSAVDVQKTWKMKKTRKKYFKVKDAALTLQRRYRATREMRIFYREFIKKKKATLCIQSWWRNLKYTKECQQKFLTYRHTIILIQIRWRRKILTRSTKQKYLELKSAAIKIQSYFRMIKVRRVYLDNLKQHIAALVLQKHYRGYKTYKTYKKQRAAVILMQRKYRAIKLGNPMRKQFLIYKYAAVTIQKNWRMFKAMKDLNQLKTAIIFIQTKWRALKLAMKIRRLFVILRYAAIKIQHFYRLLRLSRNVRKDYLRTYQIILYIQRRYRATRLMRQERNRYLKYRNRVICIQSLWRMIQLRKEYCSRINAICIIQRRWRSIIAARSERNQFLKLKMSSILIQRYYRSTKLSSKIYQDYNKLRNTIIWVQNIWRKKRIFKLQSAEYAEQQRLYKSASIIQAAWRGHKTRLLQSSEIQELRERSRKAAAQATPSLTVAYRLHSAMNLLNNFANIGQLSMCLTCIDTLTRLSPKGCTLFCKLHLVDRLYLILENSNRSLPWMDVCKRCSNILITLAKLPQTSARVRNIKETETIVRLMNTALKYDVDLFLHLATLFWLILNDSEFTEKVKTSERTMWLVRTLILSGMKKEAAASIKAKNKNSLIALSQPTLLPNLKPDWGLKTTRPRCFITVLQAISMLSEKLEIIPTN